MPTQDTPDLYAPDALTTQLNYVWQEPSNPVQPQAPPFWALPDEDTLTELIESLAEQQWRVDYIRQQLIRLGAKPKGARRVDLLRQLVERFLDPERLSRQLSTLNDEEQHFYLYLLLHTNLVGLSTQPVALDRIASFSKSSIVLTQRILDAGLGLSDENGNFFVPLETFRLLPRFYLPFATEPEPVTYTPAADPRTLLTHVQQLLSLAQTGTYRMRPRPRWRTPRVAYYGTEYQIWPPTPDDAQRLLNEPNKPGAIALCPPMPHLEAQTLAAMSANLGVSPDNAEFLYHALLNLHLVLPGSPVTLNHALIQSWMMKTPGSQFTILYHIYRNLGDWADWWPAWRAGDVQIRWNYQNLWALASVDDALRTTHYMLRWVILDILAYLPHDVWLSVDKVVEFLTKLYPDPHSHHYLQSLLCKGTHGNWKNFLGEVLRAMLRGQLYTLGLVEAAPDLEHIETFRLRHLQSLHWNRDEALPLESVVQFGRDDVVFAPRERALLITPPAKAEFLITLQQWSEPRGLMDNKLRYHLDVNRLHRTFEQGATPETLAEVWIKHADFPPTPEIQQWWQYWWERYGHVRLYTGQTTLVTRDEFTMQELQVALPTLRDALMGLVTPRVALLQTERADRIVSDLERQGYMPKEEA